MDSLYRIERQIWEARETDYIMPIWLPLIPAFLNFIAILIIVAGLIFSGFKPGAFYYYQYSYDGLINSEDLVVIWIIFILFSIIVTILNFYVVYKLVWRRNKHFIRTYLLYTAVTDYLENKGYRKEAEYIKDQLMRIRYKQELERNPVLWAILTISIPFVAYYVYHFLNKDFLNHDRSERIILDKVNKVLKDKGLEGLDIDFVSIGRFPDRDTVLYIVVSIVSLGLFNLYWLYTLAVDPNRHFREHRVIEEKLYSLLERLPDNQ